MKLNKRKMLLIIITMLAIAMFDSVKGVFIPSFVTEYQTNYKMMGWLMLSSSFAYVAGSYLGGRFLLKFGKAKVVQFASALGVVGLLVIIRAFHIACIFIGFTIVGFATALVALAVNTTVPLLDVKNHGALMNFVHFLYGTGVTMTFKGTGYLLYKNWHFKMIYSIIMAFFFALFMISLKVSLPESEKKAVDCTSLSNRQIRLVISFSLALGLYVIAEIQTITWLINFLSLDLKLMTNTATSYLSLFFIVFSLGRLFGGFIAQRFGYLKSVILSMSVAALMYFLGMLTASKGTWLIALSGAFFSICYPTIVLSFKSYFPNHLERASGMIITISSILNTIMSLMMGYIVDSFGIRVAMYTVPFSLTLSVVILWCIKNSTPTDGVLL